MGYLTKGTFETIDTVLTANAPVVNLYGSDPNLGQSSGYNGTTTETEPIIVSSTKKATTTTTKKSYLWLWWFMLLLIPFSKKLFCKQQNKRRY